MLLELGCSTAGSSLDVEIGADDAPRLEPGVDARGLGRGGQGQALAAALTEKSSTWYGDVYIVVRPGATRWRSHSRAPEAKCAPPQDYDNGASPVMVGMSLRRLVGSRRIANARRN